jgi:hypothetical protein
VNITIYNPFISRFLRNSFFVLAYFIGALIFLMLFSQITHNKAFLYENSLINWDAGQYYRIVYEGYSSYRVAFFPFFPFVWKVLGCGIYGITLFNAVVFISSTALLATVFNFFAKELLLMISFPSLIFMFLPYSEAIFFFSSVIVLVGIKKQYNWVVFIGMLLASSTRPVVYVFIPAIIVLLFLLKSKQSRMRKILFYILPVLLGLAIVLYIQYINTHDWFAFFHSQKTGWNNYFRLPKFKLTSWGGDNIVRFDGSAFWVGMLSTIALGYIFLKKLNTSESIEPKMEAILFSALYLAGICWLVLFTRGGSLFSLNRFVFATPFFFVVFSPFIKKTWKAKEYTFIFFLLNIFWLLFGSYVHIQEMLKYFALSVFLMLFLFISNSNKYISGITYVICLLGNITLQIYCYYYFLNGGWIA